MPISLSVETAILAEPRCLGMSCSKWIKLPPTNEQRRKIDSHLSLLLSEYQKKSNQPPNPRQVEGRRMEKSNIWFKESILYLLLESRASFLNRWFIPFRILFNSTILSSICHPFLWESSFIKISLYCTWVQASVIPQDIDS